MKQAPGFGRRIAFGLTLAMGFAVSTQAQDAGPKATVWPAGDIRWTDNPALKGAQTAVLWGDPTKGAYGAFRKIPGGTILPLHTHTGEHKVVGLAGTILLTIEGDAAKEVGPGSYLLIPGGVKHAATCKAGADCMYLEQSPVAYDIKWVEPAKK